jgi:hypothetical protein
MISLKWIDIGFLPLIGQLGTRHGNGEIKLGRLANIKREPAGRTVAGASSEEKPANPSPFMDGQRAVSVFALLPVHDDMPRLAGQ